MSKETKAKLENYKATCDSQEEKVQELLSNGANPELVQLTLDAIKIQREMIASLERIGGLR